MDINAVCEKNEQAEALTSLSGIGMIFHPGNTMPCIFRNEDAEKCTGFLSEPFLLVRTPDELGYLKSRGYEGTIYADHSLYTFNSASVIALKDLGVRYDTAPLELDHHALFARGMEMSELMVYGRVPMMVSAGCVFRNTNGDRCDRNIESGHEIRLVDRTDTGFPVLCVCRYCYNVIFNSVPLSLHRLWDRVTALDPRSVRLYFTTETPDEVRRIASFFIRLEDDPENAGPPPYEEYTRGHFLKSAE